MLKLLKFARKGKFFFRRIKVGMSLVGAAFKAVSFNHHKYVFYCLILALIQSFRLRFSDYIDPNITFLTIFTEFLAGQTFFEVMFDYLKFPITSLTLIIMFAKTVSFYLETVVFLYIGIAIAYYTKMSMDKPEFTVKESLFFALSKWNIILLWAIIEVIIMIFPGVLGFIGDMILTVWQLSTALNIQVIAFQSITVKKTLIKSIKLFVKTFGNILGADILINIILFIIGALLYFLYIWQVIPIFHILSGYKNLSFIIFILIFYLISVVQVAQVITFTGLYEILHENPRLLNK